MTKEIDRMTEIINFIMTELARAQASGLSLDDARQATEIATRSRYAGERVYIAGLPKQRRAVQLAKLEKQTTQKVVAITGLSRQHVWRLRRLGR